MILDVIMLICFVSLYWWGYNYLLNIIWRNIYFRKSKDEREQLRQSKKK